MSLRKLRLNAAYIPCGAGGGLGTTGAGSEGAATGAEGAIGCAIVGCTTTTGITIFCFQYATTIPRCQKRGIKSRNNMSWLRINAANHFSGARNFIQVQIPPSRMIAASIVVTT